MKLGDVASLVTIDPRKLTEYALDPEHPLGCHKAYVFERVLGFTMSTYEPLLAQIERAALAAEAHLARTDVHGSHYTVDLNITGPEGQRAVVRTGWLVATSSGEARLTTLYVRSRR